MTAFRRHCPMRSLVCSIVLIGAVTAPATAQRSGGTDAPGGAWIVVPVEPGGDEDPQATALAARLREALDASGVPVLDDTAAGERVEELVSAPVTELSENDITTWASSSQAALRALARADYDNAREALVAAQEVAQRAAAELNREAERAREVLDTCLFTARVFLETHQRTEAERQVRSCRVLVPEVEPRRHRHPPEIHALLERIDAEETNGGLEVTSLPSGCTVRINGVPQGETPFAVEQLARGDYRLQVECSEEERGRVHLVRVDEGTTRVAVDVPFDRALRSRPFPRLTVPDKRLEHGRLLAAALQMQVLVVSVGESAHVLAIAPDGSAQQVLMAPAGDASLAIGYLRERSSMDIRREPGVAIESPARPGAELRPVLGAGPAVDDEGPASPAPALPKWRLGVGLGVLGAGVATFALSAWLAAEQGARGERYQAIDNPEFATPDMSDGFLIRQRAWVEARAPLLATASISGALLGIGAGLLTPERSGVPWWAWVSGGSGVTLAVVATILAATATECPVSGTPVPDQTEADPTANVRSCVAHRQDRAAALLVGMAALPFIAVPITALVTGPGTATSLAVTSRRGGAVVTFGGDF